MKRVPKGKPATRNPKPVFEHDHRQSNPGLHLYYVKIAVGHLLLIDSFIRQASDCANLNMHGITAALYHERGVLVATNAAYADAEEIVRTFRNAEQIEEARQDARDAIQDREDARDAKEQGLEGAI